MTVYAADFETTSGNDEQIDGYTRVYLWAIQDINSKKIDTGDTIEQFISYLTLLDDKSSVFFHNLSFDGEFIISYLLYKNWVYGKNPFQFECVIDAFKNSWFSLTLHFPMCNIVIKDSLKKFPNMGIEDLAKTFGIPGKTELDVNKRRGPDYVATKSEITRCKRDVEILAHALRETFKQGMDADTSSSDAHRYFMRTLVSKKEFKDEKGQRDIFRRLFPTLLYATTDKDYHTLSKVEDTLRRGYSGGLTYLNPKYECEIVKNVAVYDRNSMYPSVMVNYPLPYGRIKKKEPGPDDLYVKEILCTFKLKPGHIPFIPDKSVYRESLVMTECEDPTNLVLPSPLYELFHTNYDVKEEEINTWVFASKKGVFDQHVKHFMNIKANTTNPGEKMLAKLRLNGLYGKFAENNIHTNKIPVLVNDEVKLIPTPPKKGRALTYLPVAMFTTAWARYDLVKAAELFGDRFIYCDTDSVHVIHQDGDENLLPLDDRKLGYWKHEGTFPTGKYVRAKLYMHGDENMRPIDIKASGLPEKARKDITFDNFDYGSVFEGSLKRKRVRGGCVLVPRPYKVNKRG